MLTDFLFLYSGTQLFKLGYFKLPVISNSNHFLWIFPSVIYYQLFLNLHYFEHRVKKKQDSTVFHIILLSRPMDFLECDPPVDFTANETAREESGYGCTRVSSYNLH